LRSKDKEAKASLVMLHGFGESSDNLLETGIHHAMNGLEVHLIDFMG
jgi:alpha-beta hydrolase superfamily lysophospholipase